MLQYININTQKNRLPERKKRRKKEEKPAKVYE
jgi:hypothetical protein